MTDFLIPAETDYSSFGLLRQPSPFCAVKKALQILLGLGAVGGFAFISLGDPLDTWQQRYPLPPGPSLYGVSYGASNFVVVGEAGAILTSVDGAAWTNRISGATDTLRGVAYGGSLFVAVGESGTILLSTNGHNWSRQNSGVSNSLYAVTFANNGFTAVGDSGTILTSATGSAWSAQNSTTSDQLLSIAYGNGIYVAAGGDFISGVFVTSSDGLTWTSERPGSPGLLSITFGKGLFAAVAHHCCGDGRTPEEFLTSADGMAWTIQTVEPNYYHSIAYGNNEFLALGYGCARGSTNGAEWDILSCGIWDNFVGFANGTFVAVGFNAGISTSTEGTNWMLRNLGPYSYVKELRDVAYGNGTFVAAGSEQILVSTNGAYWTNSGFALAGTITSITFAQGRFVAVGDSRTFTSIDGVHWTIWQVGGTVFFNDVTYGNGLFVAVGGDYSSPVTNRYVVFTSTDGMAWTKKAQGGSGFLYGVAYGNGLFVAMGPNDTPTSTDGITWNDHKGTFDSVNRVTYGDGMFVAVGGAFFPDRGIIQTSPDGITWNNQFEIGSSDLDKITYQNGTFVIVGGGSFGPATIVTSTDGITWSNRFISRVVGLYGIGFGADTFLAVGYGGLILQSGDVGVPFLEGQNRIGEGFELTMTGEIGRNYRVQASTNFSAWMDLLHVTPTQAVTKIIDSTATNIAQRVYRAVSP